MFIWLRRCGPYAIVLVLLASVFPSVVLASTICSAVVSPSSVEPGTEVVLQFDIENTGSQAVNWIQITQPDPNYSVNGISQDNWTDATTDTGTTLTGSSLAPGQTYSLQLAMQTGPSEEPAADWGISTSSDGGATSVGCTGQLATAITTPQAPPSPNGESNVGLIRLSATTATISWNSVEASTSYVYYGLDASYGKTVNVPGSTSEHTVVLTGLRPETVYHYKVAGSDGSGNNYFSGDNTFVTPEAPPVIVPPTQPPANPGSPSSVQPEAVIPLVSQPRSKLFQAVPTESTPPVIGAITTLNHVYREAPLVSGSVTDNAAVAVVDYSTDGGQNWLPVDSITGLGGSSAQFSFTPKNLDDGNYNLEIRAADTSRNIARKNLGEIVIDRLPPTVGGSTLSVGSQLVRADPNGTMHALAGLDQKIVLSAVGGPLTIDIEASSTGQPTMVQVFGLAKSPASGLWTGALSFSQGGTYQLTVKALDGAGNQTSRLLGTIVVNETGKIIDDQHSKALPADITVYYKNPGTRDWQLWAADAYGQSNPISAHSRSGYSLYLPSGTYYLKVKKAGYHTAVTQSFSLNQPTPISSDIHLKKASGLRIGSVGLYLPQFGVHRIDLQAKNTATTTASSPVPLRLPNFALSQTNGTSIRLADTFGYPTVISFVASWSPAAADQLPILATTAKTYPELKIIPVSSGESLAHLKAVSAIAGYDITLAADTNNSFLNSLGSVDLPTHLFINRSGVITKRVVGVLSSQEILKYVEN